MRRALAFLTPLGGAAAPAPAALLWFPVVGTLVGLAVGGVWVGADRIFTSPVAAALAVLSDAVLTGALHLDGLADSADGLLPPLPPARRLEVMADPRIGAFGALALGLALLLRFAALAGGRPRVLAIAGLWACSRAAMAVIARTARYARPGGLASAFLDPADLDPAGLDPAGLGRAVWDPASVDPPVPATGPDTEHRPDGPTDRRTRQLARRAATTTGAIGTTGVALALAGTMTARGLAGLAAVAAEILATAGVVLLARRRLGGFTGDVLGAAAVTGETAGLLVLAARW